MQSPSRAIGNAIVAVCWVVLIGAIGGLIALGSWMLEEPCRFLPDADDPGMTDEPVTGDVNGEVDRLVSRGIEVERFTIGIEPDSAADDGALSARGQRVRVRAEPRRP